MGIAAVVVLLAYLPFRLSRGFSPSVRTAIFLIVLFKAIVLVGLHVRQVGDGGHPIVADIATDARAYYNAGAALEVRGLFEVTKHDVISVASGRSHLGYYVVNYLAFKASPDHPMLFLRLAKLLLFHVALGMLVTTWRMNRTPSRAFIAYVVLGLLFYQLFYYNYRNLKDDVVLSLFMMIMALADRSLIARTPGSSQRFAWSSVLRWVAVGGLIWLITTFRYYMGPIIIGAFCIHLITGQGMRFRYRVGLAGFMVVGFAVIITLPGFDLVRDRGGPASLLGALTNVYGVFKMLVSPLPWQHTRLLLAPAHTLYLLMLVPALWCLFTRFRANLDWKLFVVLQIALVVGGILDSYEPRKRFVMYPILVGWIVMAGRRNERKSRPSSVRTVARSRGPRTRTPHRS